MTDGPVLTNYPHDRLSRLADIMTDALARVPGAGDVRAIVMLDDGEGGCVHPHNYPDPEGRRNVDLFVDTACHLEEMGRALGVRVEVLINGKKVPRATPSAAGPERQSDRHDDERKEGRVSLYEIAVADGLQEQRRAILLPALGDPVVQRFRDCWVERTPYGLVIAVYTRTGGPNRERCSCAAEAGAHTPESCWAAANEALAAHPLYLRDEDDTLDSTYMTFRFRGPEQYREALAKIAVDPVDTSRRWQEAIDRVSRGELRPAVRAMGDQLAAMLSDTSPGAPTIMEV